MRNTLERKWNPRHDSGQRGRKKMRKEDVEKEKKKRMEWKKKKRGKEKNKIEAKKCDVGGQRQTQAQEELGAPAYKLLKQHPFPNSSLHTFSRRRVFVLFSCFISRLRSSHPSCLLAALAATTTTVGIVGIDANATRLWRGLRVVH